MKKRLIILLPLSLLILSFIIYVNFFYVKKIPIDYIVPEASSNSTTEAAESTEANTIPSEVVEVPFDGALNTDLDESYDSSHQGSSDEIYTETPSGVYIENLSLVKDSLSTVAYSALIFALDSGEYGKQLKILERSLIVSDHIIKFSFIDQDSVMYRVIANNNDATIDISIF